MGSNLMVKYIIIGLVIASLVGALTFSGKIILDQNTQIAELSLTLESQNEAIKEATKAHAKAQKELANLQVDFNRTENSKNELAGLLARHDLEKLAKAKPGLVEDIINNGTAKVLQRFREFGNEIPTD